MTNTDVKEVLNKLVATQGLFYTRLHQFHWYIKGQHFFSLHEKFEELYNSVSESMDEVAERLLAIGGQPYSTLGEFIEHSVIEERAEDKNLSESEMVQAVINDFKTLRDFLSDGIKVTEENGDDVSNDMLIAMKGDIEKNTWMLQAFLGNDAVDKK
ncbi:non-heme iron-binding ferritin Fri [Salinibacillus aidingensis]|uniref:Non-heme iron-binding ferritin Fri n=1 Tax=Salinibacillus aidingensis TaxID=237684 RepID=A0ABN1BQ20_9BACI